LLKEFFALFHIDLIWNRLQTKEIDTILGLSWITILAYFHRKKSSEVRSQHLTLGHSKPFLYWLSWTLVLRKIVSGTISTAILITASSPSVWIYVSFVLTKLVVLKLLWNIFNSIRVPPEASLVSMDEISLQMLFPEYRVDKRSFKVMVDFYWLEYLYGKMNGLWYSRHRFCNVIVMYLLRCVLWFVMLSLWALEMACVETQIIWIFLVSLKTDFIGDSKDVVFIGSNFFRNQLNQAELFIFITCTAASLLGRLMATWMQTYNSFKLLKVNVVESFCHWRSILMMLVLNPKLSWKVIRKSYIFDCLLWQVYCSQKIDFWKVILILCRCIPWVSLFMHRNDLFESGWTHLGLYLPCFFLLWDLATIFMQFVWRSHPTRMFVLKYSNIKLHGRSLKSATRNIVPFHGFV
jgi:hypothetical protein